MTRRGRTATDILAALALVAAGALVAWQRGAIFLGVAAVAAAALWLLGRWRPPALGLVRPASLPRAMGGGVLGFVLCHVAVAVVAPIVLRFMQPPDLSPFSHLRGNVSQLVLWLSIALTTAAFGEEIIFRGATEAWLRAHMPGRAGAIGAAVITAAVFGLGHAYQGPAGGILAAVAGLTYSAARRIGGGTLWPAVIAHGLYDASGMLLLFLGAANAGPR